LRAPSGRIWRQAIEDHQVDRNRSSLQGNLANVQREHTLRPRTNSPTENEVRNAIERVTVSAARIAIVLSESIVNEGQDRLVTLPWGRTSSRRGREIIQGVDELKQPQRAMRTKARDGFVRALRAAHRWLDELLGDPNQSVESLAVREGKTERSIRMTLSLAFLSPVLAEAAMEGRLPRGFSVKRLTELPVLWSEQWSVLGLQEPIQAQTEIG
jgi:site-specific DNA recombinase